MRLRSAWLLLALLVAGCIDATPIVLERDRIPTPTPVVDPVDPAPTPAPVHDEAAPTDAVPYAAIVRIVEGMTEAELVALLGAPDASVETSRVWRNAQNAAGMARELRAIVVAGVVRGYALWIPPNR